MVVITKALCLYKENGEADLRNSNCRAPRDIRRMANRPATIAPTSRFPKIEPFLKKQSANARIIMLKALLPYRFDTARSGVPIRSAATEVEISGNEVTKASAITPIKLAEIPVISAIFAALDVRRKVAKHIVAEDSAKTVHPHFRVCPVDSLSRLTALELCLKRMPDPKA